MIAALLLATALNTLTPDDYATMPTLSSPRFSPDGTRIAYVVTRADLKRSVYDSDVWLIHADGTGDRQLTRSESSDSTPRWSPDGKRLAFLSDRGGRTGIYLIDPNGGEARQLVSDATPVRDLAWSPDGKQIAYLRIDAPSVEEERRIKEKDDARVVGENRRYVHLYLVDVESGKSKRLTNGAWSIFSFSWAPDGSAIAFDRAPGLGLDDYYRSDIYTVSMTGETTGELKPVVVRPGIDRQPVYSPDGKSIAFVSGGGVHDWLIEHLLHVVPVADGKGTGAPRVIGESYGRIPDTMIWSPDSRSIWFEGPLNTTNQLFRINADGSGYVNVSNVQGIVESVDLHGTRAAFVQQTLTAPPELHVSDTTRFAPRQLTRHNDALRAKTIGETRLIRWKNPDDGLEIEGLLTLPVGYKPGSRVPLLTFVHGGPASRFDQAFLGYLGHVYAPHALAAKGFAVLRPNPRGTGGYGQPFRQANRNDWGGKDWVDINAGIDKLLADGIADPDRLGLMGWSYGGFIATWAIGRSDRLKAISVGAPVTDLLSFHGTSDIRDFLPHYFDRREPAPAPEVALDEMRHAPLSLELLRAHSPLWHLKPSKAKVLIQHGEADDRVPLSQGTMLYRVLDELGVDVAMVTYPRTPHVAREPKLRIDVARRNLDFFTRWLMP